MAGSARLMTRYGWLS